MATVGIRELRQDASELVRRAEAGESITVSVNGHPAAVLSPLPKSEWVLGAAVNQILARHHDPTWAEDVTQMRDELTEDFRDPWDEMQP